jgi:hypothetical protein
VTTRTSHDDVSGFLSWSTHTRPPWHRTLAAQSIGRLRARFRACGRSRPGLWLTRLDSWTVGSLMFLSSWAVLMGPMQYAVHLISGARLPFTAAYFGSIIMTIYFAVGVSSTYHAAARHCLRFRQLHSTILTLFSAIVQLVALVWYLVSYFPMGSTGLRFAARVGGSRVTAWMND